MAMYSSSTTYLFSFTYMNNTKIILTQDELDRIINAKINDAIAKFNNDSIKSLYDLYNNAKKDERDPIADCIWALKNR